MPGKVKVKVLAGRNLPVMDRSSDTTDAFVEIKLGNVTYKTDVCRKTLNPHWNSEWYTFEVEDAELQDEPLQIRLMDYDTYTANDAIGKVYINLSPLLHSTSKSRTGKGSITSGWLPVYDTIHGVRGEIHVIVKVDLFTDFNKFRQSSCGVLFFHSSNIPYGYSIAMYHGFVEELVVNDDPEYQWIDKIRTPRASNEARQLAFMKLSAQVQRKIGIKAIEMGANAVIGYMQCYDLEGDVGVVARGIGTAVSLTKINESFSQHIGEEILVEEHKLSGSSDFGDAPRRAIGISVEANNHASGNSPTKLGTPIVNALLTKDSACVPICRRSSDSDLSITPKGSSCPLDKSIGIVRNYGANNGNTKSIMIMNYDMLEMLEYPFFTMTKYPAGIIRYIGATVTARSVKLLERVPNPNEPETRDSWWNEIRTEVRSHARSLGCNVILGYVEQTTIDDDICVLSATGTAAVINLQFGTDMWMADASLNASGDGGAEVGGKEHMTSSLDRQDFDRECSGSREQTPNTVEADGIYDGVSGMSSKCTICHVPYSLGSVNFRINAVKCSMCKNGIVPDVLITTIEIPDGVPVSGRGSLIQAHTCRLKRDLKSEANGKEISDALPFLEYELHKLLVNKLKIKGMNAIFGLRSNITIGEKTIALIATGTAVYLTALPKPLLPQIVDSSTFPDERKLQELQKMVQSIVEQNIHAYQLQCVYDSDAEQLQSSAGGTGPGAREEREGGGKELDLVCMQKSACVLELDDIFDLDLLTFEKEPEIAPDGFYVVNLQTMPGISAEVLDNVRQFQMFTQVWRAKLPYSLQHTTRNLNKRFQGLLKLIYYKLRSMRPCVLCDLRYKLDFPEPDEIQIVVSGMTLGLGDGTSRLKRKCSTQTHQTPGPSPSVHGNATREHSAPIRSSNDDDMMFSLDEDSMDTSGPPSSASAATTPVPSIVKSFKTRGTKSMTSSSYHSKINRSAKMIPLKDGYGVDITTLSYIPGGKIEKYLGNLNFFFIRECTSIRETGGICGFVHSFISEVLSIVRAHVTSLGGNAMIAFYLNDLTLLDNVHKNQHLNFDQQYVPRGTTYYDKTIRIDKNPIKTALNVCKHLISRRVYAVVVSHEPTGDLSPAAVSYTSGFYQIPVIGISSREAAFSDKNIHVSFLRTVPPYYHQADVWLEILSHFGYTKVIIIHSSDTDGRAVLGRFQTTSQTNYDDIDVRATVESIVEFEPKLDSFSSYLMDMKTAQSRVYLLYASQEDAYVIFRDAAIHNMTEYGHIWIVTEQALSANNTPTGIIGLKLNNAENETDHIRDAIYILASAIKEMTVNETITEAPKDCDDSGAIWESGKRLFGYLKTRNIRGETGQVAFDDNGDRMYAEYDVINVHENHSFVKVGSFHYDSDKRKMRLKINDSSITWPGNTGKKPEGIMIPTHLKVLTIEEKPFVYARKLLDDEIDCADDEVVCPHFNITNGNEQEYCCKGYCIDLLKALAQRINFTYDLALSPDGQFGHYQLKNHTTGIGTTVKKEWNGLIGELVAERADLIVAPLTINPERAEFIEFSKPFKYQGITILEKKPSRSSTLVSFLQPFSNTLWILVMVSVHVVALVLYLLDRFSPFGRFKLSSNDGTEEDALNLSSAIWFAWGVLLNSGIGEGTPRSFSARVLGMVWAGFAMIIVASYTANLAAFLVLERPKTKLTGINDARLRNTMENLTCATVKGSSVDMYFRRQVELSNMYRTMEANNYDTAEQAIQDVKDGKLMAFIWDSSRLEYEASKDCELVTAGELFGRSGYGVGLQKGSPWTDAVTLAILDFHESGFMESLDKEWIFHGNVQQCEQFEKTPNTLGLKNMAGVFILVGAGIVGGIGLIIIEVIYKKHQIKKQKKMEIARHAADKWRGTIEKRKTLRASLAMQRQYNVGLNSVSKSVSSQNTEKTRYPILPPLPRTPERAWPKDKEYIVNRKNNSAAGKPPPRYMPTYATDVSHLIV